MNSARLVIMRTLRPGFLICMASYDVASTIHQSLAGGCGGGAGDGSEEAHRTHGEAPCDPLALAGGLSREALNQL
jgi:hypothetical protein